MSLINRNNKISQINEQSLVRLNQPQKQVFTINAKANDELEKISLKGLIALLLKLGIDQIEFDYNQLQDLPERFNVQKKYKQLFIEIIEELLLQEYLSVENKKIIVAQDIDTTEMSMKKVVSELEAFGNEFQDYKAHTRLLIRCFTSFETILLGEIRATDVIFPLGTLEHVEGIYKGNKQADYFNALLAEQVAESVADVVNHLSSGETIKILEIGAGTGGTTKSVFEKLIPFGDKIEYTFTDLSKSFLINAEKSFGKQMPHFETQLLDIENDPITQGFTKAKYDIVIAANVLHATKDITRTISNLKRILKSQGIVFLNEIAKKELFTTLTFGLLDGWWLYEDAELRLRNNPGLSAENWAMVLDEVGFEQLCFYPLDNRCSQQIIAAQSNGLIEEMSTVQPQFTQMGVKKESPKENNYILDELKELFAAVLQTDSNRLDIHAPFEELGIDSILIGTLAKELGNKIGDVSTTIFFEYGTIEELSGYVMEHYSHLYKTKAIPTITKASIEVKTDLRTTVENYLKSVFAAILQYEEHKIDVNAPLEELGIDSIMIGSIAKKMQEKIGEIPTTVFFEFTTIVELGQYLIMYHPTSFEEEGNEGVPFERQSKSRFENQENNKNDEVIAIIGLSGKYPEADNVEELWENLKAGKNSVTEIPVERWDNTIYFDELKGKAGKNYCKYGGFINGVDEFDPLFFKISPREAERMDPQERLFLQIAWEAVEDAGYNFKDLSRRSERFENIQSGVYVGVMYEEYQLYGAAIDTKQGKVALGGNPASIANRVSYCLDFDGPSMAVDTMCSSSLTSIHLAYNDLKNKDVDVAIAGGVNVTVHPNKYLVLSQGTFLSPNGKCESFGDQGQGFVPGEGVGAVVLKRLSDAIKDGDHIYATIQGTAINHGGKGNGYTIPNPAAQAKVITKALNKAGLSGNDIDYIEAHGTGTVMGDPIEIEGLTRAFATNEKQFCKIGSIKSNIGHCESAAGISGLTKVIMQLKYKQLVPSLHSTTINPKIDFANSPFCVQQKLEPWNVKNGKLRLAGISGFGAGGSNAHIIIQEYPEVSHSVSSNQPALIVLSARNKTRLKVIATRLNDFLEKNKNASVQDIAYTLQVGRVEMEERVALVVTDTEILKRELSLFIADVPGIYKTGNINEKQVTSNAAKITESIENGDIDVLSAHWSQGEKINWDLLHKNDRRRKLSLPTYPFEKQKYWFDSFLKKEEQSINKQISNGEIVKTLYNEQVIRKEIKDIHVEYVENGIAVVHMKAKETKNMFTYDFVNDLYATFNDLKANDTVNVVVLTGYDNVFAMGGAKEGLLDLSNNKGKYTDVPFIYKGLLEFDLPVITAMQGHALGGGFVFGLYGDIIVLSEKSTYCANFMNYGFTPGMGATQIIGEKLGKNIANEMLFTGRMYSGKEIADNGATVRISANVLKEALKIAREMTSKPREALKLLKQKLAHDILIEQEYHIQKEIEMQNMTFGTLEVKAKISEQFNTPNHLPASVELSNDQLGKRIDTRKIILESPQSIMLKGVSHNSQFVEKVKLSDLSERMTINEEPDLVIDKAYLTDKIREIISSTLHIDQIEIVSGTLFVDLGLDSINGVEILREINNLLNISLEGPVLYEHGTVNTLVKYLFQEHGTGIITNSNSLNPDIDILSNVIAEKRNNFSNSEIKLHLKKIISDSLHLDETEIETDQLFTELGMDSINGVEILREINSTYNINLESAVLYEYSTLSQLSDHVQRELNLVIDTTLVSEIAEGNVVVPKENDANEIVPMEEVQCALQAIIANSLHLNENQIQKDLHFTELGMDSINGVEIIREVNAVFDTVLEASDLYKYTTINELAKILIQQNTNGLIESSEVMVSMLNTEPFDLSYMQQAYWIGENKDLELGGKQAHLTVRFRYPDLEIDRLNNAVNKLIQRHDILKVKFLENGQQQVVNERPSFVTQLKSLENLPTNQAENTILEFVDAKRRKGPNKFEWPQFDFTVFKTNEKDELIINLSLLICDGGSVSVFFQELFEIYFNPEKQLPDLTVTFQDYINHLNKQKKSEKYKKAKDYWKNRINTLPLGPELAYQSGNESGVMVHKERKIDRQILKELKEKAKKNNISLSVLLCTIYTKVLAYYSRNQHFSLTMMTLGREYPSAEINKVLGNFSRISVLELDYRNKQNFLSELKYVSNQIWEDQKHNSYNGIEVIRDLNLNRGILGKTAIPMTFASAFGLGYNQNYDFERISASLQVPQVAMDHQVCEESDGRLLISFDIDEGFFQNNVTDHIIASYEKLIQQVAKSDWNEVIEGILLEEHLELINETNNTGGEITEHYLFDPFDSNAFAFPNKLAVIDGEIQKTYGEIQELSNQIGNYLRTNGTRPNQLVGVMMHKGWEEVPSTLGIMKSGGAYLPIDPTMPESRLAFILEKAAVKEVIVTAEIFDKGIQFPEGVNILVFDKAFLNQPTTKLNPVQQITDLAYTIFTSGSTGFPKGVMIDHKGALNTCLDINKRFNRGKNDVVLALSALYFDLSVYDIFGLLACGGTIVYPNYQKLKDPGHWGELIEKHGITIWNSVPELMNMLMEYNMLLEKKVYECLNLVMMSGDWIPVTLPSKIKQALPAAKIVSLGGATEASIWSVFHEINEVNPEMKSIPYGKALTNQTMHVLNDQLEPCPILTTGNIFIGGIGVAKGYLKDEEKTNAHFITHPKTKEIIYKTGDLGRVLNNGDIEFLGREDFQVKVQGYRIELGDIESAVLRSEMVKAIIVDVKKDVIGNNFLVAYVVPQNETVFSEKELLRFLQGQLQTYMVPKFIVTLNELPISKNGKIDRKNLPEPRPVKKLAGSELIIPTEIRTKLKTIWEELLKLDCIEDQDDFFELGGNSLLAIRLVAKIENNLEITIDLSEILQYSNFKEQLNFMITKIEPKVNEMKSIVCIKNSDGNGQPLFLVHPIGGSVFCYNQLVRNINLNTPVYGFHATGNQLKDVASMATKYIKEMKEIQKDGPYNIGGWSFGGIVAFEMTQQLEKNGDEVKNLFLIDSYFHSKGYDFENTPETEIFEKFLKDIIYQKGGEPIFPTTMDKMLNEAIEKGLFPSEMTLDSVCKLLEVFKNNCIAYSKYQATHIVNADAHLIMAKDTSYIGSERQMKTWENWLNGGINYYPVQGNHFTIFEGESLLNMQNILNVESKLIHS